jgi:sulfatase maturation enzyme AslB (radical SAM superfamily)
MIKVKLLFDKKILCLGNNSSDTDQRTSDLASQDNTVNYGMILSGDFLPELPGYYHTSVVDLSSGEIIKLAKKFHHIILLDQPIEEWEHPTVLETTYKTIIELDQLGYSVEYKNNENIKKFDYWHNLVQENKSFCIHPWTLQIEENGQVVLCPRSTVKISDKKLSDINWQTDADYQRIRQNMLEGKHLHDHCKVCYDYEAKGIESYRQFETKEWASRLQLESVNDLDNIEKPYFFDVRLSNKCNLMCRSCNPDFSNLIEKELKEFKITHPTVPVRSFKYSNLAHIDIKELTKKHRVYLTGGEPTVMQEVYDWMQECIDKNKTNFNFTLGTNGQRINKKFLNLTKHFTDLNFSVSLDGFGIINDYWRWGSKFETVIENMHVLKRQGHNININCVPGIYNVTNLHLLLEYLDREFSDTTIYMQINYLALQSAYNNPNAKLVLESMDRCKQTSVYFSNGKSCKTTIDSLYDYYSNSPTCDLKSLKEFFEYNDKLDQARNVRLIDYIPELEACRKYIQDIK